MNNEILPNDYKETLELIINKNSTTKSSYISKLLFIEFILGNWKYNSR